MRHRAFYALPVLVGLLSLAAPRRASAQETTPTGFGEKNALIISADRLVPLLSYSSQTVTSSPQNGPTQKTTDSGTSIAFLFGREPNLGASVHTLPRVAFDFAIIRHLTLGGSFAFAVGLSANHEENLGNNNTRSSDGGKTSVIGFAPRAGYVLPIGDTFAFWPRLGFAYYSVSTKADSVGNGGNTTTTTNSDSVLSIDVDPQFVWDPIEHFFFHFGPLLNIPIGGSRSIEVATGSNTLTTKNDFSNFHFGLSAGLGGWFDL